MWTWRPTAMMRCNIYKPVVRALVVDNGAMARKHIKRVPGGMGIEHILYAEGGVAAEPLLESDFFDFVVTD